MPYVDDENDPESAALFEYWKRILEEKPAAGTTTEEPQTMKPDEESEQTGTDGTGNEGTGNEGASNENQMPPSHYSSHPSCPGTVTCPYTGRTYPADPRDDTREENKPAPTLHKKKKKKKKDANGNLSSLMEKEKGTEDVPVHTEVDTMEYRRSDAHKGEFAPMPE
jgi:hypothetical protein